MPAKHAKYAKEEWIMKFPYGNANFEKIRTEGYFYVDKTQYIEVLENLPESHIVILRSRRFGKTLFCNMLGWYYDKLHIDRFEELFHGTYISDHLTPRRNTYMMLTFNFSGLNTQTLENAIESMLDINVVSDYRKIRAILAIGEQPLEEQILTRIVEGNTVSINRIAELFVLTRETEFLFDSKALTSLLFYMGYLTIVAATRTIIELAMPNVVLKSLYLDYMEYILMKRAQVRIDGLKQDEMLRDLLEGNIDLLLELTVARTHRTASQRAFQSGLSAI